MKILLLLLLPSVAFADLKNLVWEFRKVNSDIVGAKESVELTVRDKMLLEATNALTFNAYSSKSDDQKDAASAIFTLSKVMTYGFGLNQKLPFGGVISFDNYVNRTDRSLWSATVLGNGPQIIYDYNQKLSYTQNLWKDFFGRQYFLDKKVADLNTDVATNAADAKSDQLVLVFFNNYEDARLQKTLVYLQEEALKRATKRKKNIARKVRDGLRNKVDLHQANIALISQKENFRQAKANYTQALEELSKGVHRKVTNEEVKIILLSRLDTQKKITGQLEDNYDYLALKKKVEIINLNLQKIKNTFAPALSLKVSIDANDFDEQRSRAISKGWINKNQNEKIISLNLSMPIGFQTEKLERQKAAIERVSRTRDMVSLKKNLDFSLASLNQKIELYRENLALSHEKRKVAFEALKGQNRLYNLGRASLDAVIRSEEDLINAERSVANYTVALGKSLALHASLFSKVVPFINIYKE